MREEDTMQEIAEREEDQEAEIGQEIDETGIEEMIEEGVDQEIDMREGDIDREVIQGLIEMSGEEEAKETGTIGMIEEIVGMIDVTEIETRGELTIEEETILQEIDLTLAQEEVVAIDHMIEMSLRDHMEVKVDQETAMSKEMVKKILLDLSTMKMFIHKDQGHKTHRDQLNKITTQKRLRTMSKEKTTALKTK